MIIKFCSRCGAPVVYPASLCEACKEKIRKADMKRWHSAPRSRDTAKREKAFYRSAAWRLAKIGYFNAHGHWCIDCLNELRFGYRLPKNVQPVDEVHHVISLEENFALRLDPDNLVGLCHTHHDIRHGRKKPLYNDSRLPGVKP